MAAARSLQSFYMHPALCRLARFPMSRSSRSFRKPQNVTPAFRTGRPTEHLPKLSPDDVVYTSGAPAMTEALRVSPKPQAPGATPIRSCPITSRANRAAA